MCKGWTERHHILAHFEKTEAKTIFALHLHREIPENEKATIWKHNMSN